MNRPLLELRNVRKSFRLHAGFLQMALGRGNSFIALDDVSLAVHAGETLGIVGESGSGKSTLSSIAMRLTAADAGQILFEGTDITHASRRQLQPFRAAAQMIFQDSSSSLNPRKTVSSTLHRALSLHGVGRKVRRDRAVALLDLVGLDPSYLDRFPHQLSGGQRQRVSIARGLAAEPKLLIADEPVAALDVSLQAQIVNLLIELRRKLNLTLIFVSHDLALVRYVSTRVVVMHQARIVEIGSVSEVFNAPASDYTRALLAAVPKGASRYRSPRELRPDTA